MWWVVGVMLRSARIPLPVYEFSHTTQYARINNSPHLRAGFVSATWQVFLVNVGDS